jgi:N-acetyl sugar amidotransferase
MDTQMDNEIRFDANGICSYCHAFDQIARPILERARTEEGRQILAGVVKAMKAAGQGSEYDCILGLSGGIDSSYMAYQAKKLGLRILAVHVDGGWNSELAVANIENIVKKLDIDLVTCVVDWDEMRDLQLAFFKASLLNCDIPQDHAFFAALRRTAEQHNIRYVLEGTNWATEFVMPKTREYNASDLRHLHAVHKRFGTDKLRKYPTLGFFRRYVYHPFVRGIKIVKLLDLLPYDKEEAKRIITDELDWRDYGGKHYESVFTRFFQGYYLPVKFEYDKRRAHLSSLIVSGQLQRGDALEEMEDPPYPSPELLREDKEFVAKKLGLTLAEFDAIIALPPNTYKDFPSNELLFRIKDWVMGRGWKPI